MSMKRDIRRDLLTSCQIGELVACIGFAYRGGRFHSKALFPGGSLLSPYRCGMVAEHCESLIYLIEPECLLSLFKFAYKA